MSAPPRKAKVTQGDTSDAANTHAQPASPPPPIKGGGGGDAVRNRGESKVTRKPPVPKAVSAGRIERDGESSSDPTALRLEQGKNETSRQVVARAFVGPFSRHGHVAANLCATITSALPAADQAGLTEYAWEMKGRAQKVAAGDLGVLSDLLTAQALTLDGIFTEMARRSVGNMGEYLDAAERYMRLALKAQAGSRATLEALAKLHQPREQTVRHVHVNEGGQAIVADQFHQHAGGQGNGNSVKQSDATGAAGRGAALPSPDAIGQAVPVPRRERETPVPNARRDESGRARRKR